MHGSVTISARSPDFQRAFVALCYYFGARGEALSSGLGTLPAHATTTDLLGALGHGERQVRAQALGAELGRLTAALEQRGLVR
jgi:hypothetical protein